MKPLLTLLVLAFALIRIRRVPGFKLRFNRSNRTFGLVVGTLVVLALLVAINPETRIFLLFLDSFGVDLFVALCALFVRHSLELCVAILLIPILKGIYRWGPVPGFWPSGVVLKSSASWAGYAVLYPAAALFMGVLFVRCMFFGVWT
jgi:hypothetical protein